MKKQTEIRVLIVEPDKKPYEKVIKNELETLQKTVGGYIEVVGLSDNATIVCNEEGKINGLPLNRPLTTPDGEVFDIVVGTFLIAGDDWESGEFISLTDEQVAEYTEQFKYPKMFLRSNDNGIVAINLYEE